MLEDDDFYDCNEEDDSPPSYSNVTLDALSSFMGGLSLITPKKPVVSSTVASNVAPHLFPDASVEPASGLQAPPSPRSALSSPLHSLDNHVNILASLSEAASPRPGRDDQVLDKAAPDFDADDENAGSTTKSATFSLPPKPASLSKRPDSQFHLSNSSVNTIGDDNAFVDASSRPSSPTEEDLVSNEVAAVMTGSSTALSAASTASAYSSSDSSRSATPDFAKMILEGRNNTLKESLMKQLEKMPSMSLMMEEDKAVEDLPVETEENSRKEEKEEEIGYYLDEQRNDSNVIEDVVNEKAELSQDDGKFNETFSLDNKYLLNEQTIEAEVGNSSYIKNTPVIQGSYNSNDTLSKEENSFVYEEIVSECPTEDEQNIALDLNKSEETTELAPEKENAKEISCLENAIPCNEENDLMASRKEETSLTTSFLFEKGNFNFDAPSSEDINVVIDGPDRQLKEFSSSDYQVEDSNSEKFLIEDSMENAPSQGGNYNALMAQDINPFVTNGGIANSPVKPIFTKSREDIVPNKESESQELPDGQNKEASSLKNHISNIEDVNSCIDVNKKLLEDETAQITPGSCCLNAFPAEDVSKGSPLNSPSITIDKSITPEHGDKAHEVALSSHDNFSAEQMKPSEENVLISRRSYNFDAFMSEDINPFISKGGIANSPPKEVKEFNSLKKKEEIGPEKKSKSDELPGTMIEALSYIENYNASIVHMEESNDDNNIQNQLAYNYNLDASQAEDVNPIVSKGVIANSPVKKVYETISLKANNSSTGNQENFMEDKNVILTGKKAKSQDVVVQNVSPHKDFNAVPMEEPKEDEYQLKRGSYNLDALLTEDNNPFVSKGGIANSPAKNVHEDIVPEQRVTSPVKVDQTIVTENKEAIVMEKEVKAREVLDKKIKEASPKKLEHLEEPKEDENVLIQQGSYNLDALLAGDENPFVSKGGIPNSPVHNFEQTIFSKSKNIVTEEKAQSPKLQDKMVNVFLNDPVPQIMNDNSCAVPIEEPIEDNIQIKRGSYNLDALLAEDVNLFISEGGIPNSPAKEQSSSEEIKAIVPEKTTKSRKLSEKKVKTPEVKIDNSTPESVEVPMEDENVHITRGSYNLDSLLAEDVDPFVSKGGIANSPVKMTSSLNSREKEEEKEKTKETKEKAKEKSKRIEETEKDKAVNEEKKEKTQDKIRDEDQEKKEKDKIRDEDKENSASVQKPTIEKRKKKAAGKSKMREMMEAKRKAMQQSGNLDIFEDVQIIESAAPATAPATAALSASSSAIIKTTMADEPKEKPTEKVKEGDDFGLTDEDFQPAENFFCDPSALDSLANRGVNQRFSISQSSLARDSLYVKFDPLLSRAIESRVVKQDEMAPPPPPPPRRVGQQSSGGDSSPPRESMILIGTPPAKHRDQAVKLSARKPNNLARVRNSDADSAQSGVDLLSGSPARTPTSTRLVVPEVEAPSARVAELEAKLRQTELDFQSRILQKEKELEDEKKKWKEKERELKEAGKRREKERDESEARTIQMESVVKEFEVTIQSLILEREKAAAERAVEKEEAEKERQALADDVASVERSFSDLYKRYDKARELIQGFQSNEEALKKCAEEFQTKLVKQNNRYSALKEHAEAKLEEANQAIAEEKRRNEAESAKYKASLKLSELKVSKLEKAVEEKNNENEELTKICEELMSRVDAS